MAWYKYSQYLQASGSDAYDRVFSPGEIAPWSGIYRCTTCHTEAACNQNQPLPPQTHHVHVQSLGPIRWTLIVYAEHRPR